MVHQRCWLCSTAESACMGAVVLTLISDRSYGARGSVLFAVERINPEPPDSVQFFSRLN
jgi:hypothetical protein